MRECRCTSCGKKLCESDGDVNIVCTRCDKHNEFKALKRAKKRPRIFIGK